MKILALDTATKTGWAFKDSEKPQLYSGVIDAKPKSGLDGERFRTFNLEIEFIIGIYNPDVIVYEKIVGGLNAGGHTTFIQKGLEAFVHFNAFAKRIPVRDFAAATIKKWATGSGVLTNDKGPIIAATLGMYPGHNITVTPTTKKNPYGFDDNECDAIVLLNLAFAVFSEIEGSVHIPDQNKVTEIARNVTAEKWKSRNSSILSAQKSTIKGTSPSSLSKARKGK